MAFFSRSGFDRWVLVALILGCCSCAVAQDTVVEAELAQNLSADLLNTGSSFVLKVLAPWRGAHCSLAPGALLHATVETVTRAPSGHAQRVSFAVRTLCGDEAPLHLFVTSLLAPSRTEVVMEQFPGFGSLGQGPQPQANPQTFDPTSAMRGTAQVNTTTTVQSDRVPKTVKLGEVWHLPRIELILPSRESTLSTIATTKYSLRLPIATIFVLQDARLGKHAVSAVPAVGNQHMAVSPPAVHPFVGPCRAGSCTPYAPTHATAGSGFQPMGNAEDLSRFGLKPERDRDVSQLELSATVHFVGDDELLVTFPTHELVRRTGKERPSDDPQAVRAVLFQTKTRAVERVENWVIDDHNAYVWPFGGNLLVHAGQALKVYGPGLQERATLPLALPLHSLRASPDGAHLIVGELHELHSREDHQLLIETDIHGPKEEVLWTLLDGTLKRIRALGETSNFVPTPVLLNDGVVELRKGQEPEWYLVGRAWDGTGEKQLGGLRSSCLPVLDNTSPNLLSIATCDTAGTETHTFLVHENGSPVLEQTSPSQELPVYFAGSGASRRLALMRTGTDDRYNRGLPFRLGVIRNQVLQVFGTENGSLVATVPVPGTTYYSHAFDLSPDGTVLALLSGQRLILYALPR